MALPMGVGEKVDALIFCGSCSARVLQSYHQMSVVGVFWSMILHWRGLLIVDLGNCDDGIVTLSV